jgi:hypothetical protein
MYGCSGVAGQELQASLAAAAEASAAALMATAMAPAIKDNPLSPTHFLLKEIR